MPFVNPNHWQPKGIDALESAAQDALRHPGSTCVVAGPGAGKTEFLAQKAAYLLETGICPPPYRVLAISFKTDAANNLAERVRKRCPAELSGRFASLTFDAFTKGLVDRFMNALPEHWCPTKPYDVLIPKKQLLQNFLAQTGATAPPQWRSEIEAILPLKFEPETLGQFTLSPRLAAPQSGTEHAIARWLSAQLRSRPKSKLTFTFINRLAQLLLRLHPHILRALRTTYPFVFVDEFQDTTYAQYDFLLTAFSGEQTTLTAVGDDKQRIMVFAGARPDAFNRFAYDFGATRFTLRFNYRSSPDLVHIQHVVAQSMDPEAQQAESRITRQVDGDVAQVWCAATKVDEAYYLANWLTEDMTRRNRTPRDYALLVKQLADVYELEISPFLTEVGLSIRNESRTIGEVTLQELLADEFCRLVIATLRLGATRRHPEAWQIVSSAVLVLRDVDPNDDAMAIRTGNELTTFLTGLRNWLADAPPTENNARNLLALVYDFLDINAFARNNVKYGSGGFLPLILKSIELHLIDSTRNAGDWTTCLDNFDGVGQIPLMTVHKSKGLEYDTIVFLGLDDAAWWSYSQGDHEGQAAFFVALSRARQRAIFAFCRERGQRRNIADLYVLLSRAGVPEISVPPM